MATQRNTKTTRTAKPAKPATKRGGRAKAQDNVPASKPVKGNGETIVEVDGVKVAEVTHVDVPELTPAQQEELRQAKLAKSRPNDKDTLTLNELLTKRVAGVGAKVAEQSLEATSLLGKTRATREQLDRANAAPTEKAGLRGKALAMWVLTGDSNGGVKPQDEPKPEPKKTTTTTTARKAAVPAELEGKAGRDLLIVYLKETTSNAKDAIDKRVPTVTDGKLRVKAPEFQAWLTARLKNDVGRNAVTAILKDAGLVSEQWSAMPAGKRVVYAGDVPAGTGKLPQRKADTK